MRIFLFNNIAWSFFHFLLSINWMLFCKALRVTIYLLNIKQVLYPISMYI